MLQGAYCSRINSTIYYTSTGTYESTFSIIIMNIAARRGYIVIYDVDIVHTLLYVW